MKTSRKYNRLIYIVFISCSIISCEKFVDPGLPKSKLVAESAFLTDASATSTLIGLYSSISGVSTGIFINYQVTVLGGLMSDELVAPTSTFKEFYQNTVLPTTAASESLWNQGYNFIYQSNAIIQGVSSSVNITPITKQTLLGEALFVRALCHFYLLNLYGEIPYITTTEYVTNNLASRMPIAKVNDLMITDLNEAIKLLPETYSSSERIRPNKWTASALLSRVYLYKKDWINAERVASSIIEKSTIYRMNSDLKLVFVKTSVETLWQLKPSVPNYNTIEGNYFILNAVPTTSYLSAEFTKSFEKNDRRKLAWVDSLILGGQKWHYPAKYKVKSGANPSEYLVLFRLAEQFLISAEALANQNKLPSAITVLDVIRERAGLPLIRNINPNIQQGDLLLAIEQERKAEFFAEMGHRWFDLKRTDRANIVLSKPKAPNWQTEDQLLPIPKSQIDADVNMVQNPGYTK